MEGNPAYQASWLADSRGKRMGHGRVARVLHSSGLASRQRAGMAARNVADARWSWQIRDLEG